MTSHEIQIELQGVITSGGEYHIVKFKRPENRHSGKQLVLTEAYTRSLLSCPQELRTGDIFRHVFLKVLKGQGLSPSVILNC